MGEITGISWTDHTFNPWIGCTRVSAACDHCYAETLVKRYGWAKWGAGEARKRTSDGNWRKPLQWNRKAAAAGVRRRVFCASLADVFDAEVIDEWRIELMGLIRETPSLDWLLLTKRPQVAKKFFDSYIDPPLNIWLGTTAEDQKMLDLRAPILRSIPAKVHFLSVEPMLGPMRLNGHMVDWVICGGESGPGAREMPEEWAWSLREQCGLTSTAFFMKQMGGERNARSELTDLPVRLRVREFPKVREAAFPKEAS